MADITISKFTTQVLRQGSTPASPGFAVDEGQNPTDPSGNPPTHLPVTIAPAADGLSINDSQVLGGAGTTSQYLRGDGSLATFPALTGFVPYTGATANVDLGEFGVDAGFVQLDTTPTNTPTTQGTIFWDEDDETVDVVLNGYIMKIGEDQFYPVKNQTGSSIAKGTSVRFAGTVGASGRLLIAPFIANGTVSSSFFMGVTAEAIANGEDGKVLYFGRIRGINTNAFNEGDVLYASTTVAGGFQTAVPVAPNNIVQVAAVINKSINQGVIFIRPSFGSNINQDEGVKIVTPTTGQLLQLQANGLWENKTKAQVLGGTSSQFVKGDGSLDSNVYALNSALANYQLTSEKAQPNGYASLDSNGKVPLVQINDALIGNVNFQGLWNAATNTPTLANPPSSGTKGYYYIVSTAGSFAGIDFEVGDWIISNGTAWGKVDNTDAVSSVFGRTGNVTATNGDYNTSQVTELTNLYYTEARVNANTNVAANTAARHNAVTLGTSNGLSLSTQVLSLGLASAGVTGALSGTDWSTFNSKQPAGNYVTTDTAQTITGVKTFSQDIIVNSVEIGRGSGNVSSNTSVGVNSLEANTTGSFNTSIGSETLNKNTTGFNNTAVGRVALGDNTTGNNNTAFGNLALYLNTTGSQNTGIGYSALGGITTGINNVAVGHIAGNLINSGADNITSSNSVYLGHDTRASASGNSNEIVIGHEGRGNGSNTVTIGNSSITNNYFTGNIRGGAFIKSGGTSAQFLKADGSVDSTSYGTGSVTSVAALTLGTTGTDLSSTVANGTTTPVITLNVPTASAANRGALSAADWTTFNNKQNALTNPVTGTGTTNFLPKFTGASTIGNSIITDNGGIVSVINGTLALSNAFNLTGRNAANTLNIALIGRNSLDRVIIDADGYGTNIGGGGSVLLNRTGGRVGIGTDSPQATLDVNGATSFFRGQIAFTGSDGVANGIALNYVDGASANSVLNIRDNANSANRVTFLQSGNVGIGTITPATKLHISGAGAQTLRIENTNTAIVLNNIIGSIVFQSNDASVGGTGVAGSINSISEAASGVNYGLGFNTKTFATEVERMRITAEGNVGIGTDSPQAILSSANTGALTLDSNDGNHTGFGLFIQAPSTINTVNSAIGFGQTTGRKLAAIGMQTYADSDEVGLNFYVQPNAAGSLGILTEAMRITSSGNVGIGRDSPNTQLHIGAALNIAPQLRLELNDSGLSINAGQEYAGIQWAGNDAQGNGVRADIRVFGEGTSGETYMAFGTMPAGTNNNTNATERMRITSAGRLLLGTTTESTFLLDVNGTARVSGEATFSSSVTATQFVANGNSAGGFEGLRIINASTGAAQIVLNNSAQSWLVNTRTDNQFSIFNATSSTTPFLIATSGSATFSSTVTATNGLFVSGTNQNTIGSGSLSLINFSAYNSSANQSITLGLALDTAVNNNAAYNYLFNVGGNADGQNLTLSSRRNGIADLTILTVNGNNGASTFSSSVTAASFIPSGSTIPTNGMYLPSANTIAFSTNTTEAMRITSGGNVLIGIATDNANKLRVNGNVWIDGNVAVNAIISTDGAVNTFINPIGGSIIYGGNTGGVHQFLINSSERFRVTNTEIRVTGNVLINNSVSRFVGFGTGTENPYVQFAQNGSMLFNVETNDTYTFQRGGSSFVTFTGNGIETLAGGIRTVAPTGTAHENWRLGRALLATSSDPEDTWIRVQLGTKIYDILAIDRGNA